MSDLILKEKSENFFEFFFKLFLRSMLCVCRVVERLGGKDRAMAMLNHEDASVRYQALLAVQKMMVQNW
jgi:V-ATPase subunit H